MSPAPRAAGQSTAPPARLRALSATTLGVFAVVGLVLAFSLSSTLVKRAESPGVLVAFWRMVAVSVVWNVVLWSTGRRVTLRDLRQVLVPGVFFGLNLAVFFAGATDTANFVGYVLWSIWLIAFGLVILVREGRAAHLPDGARG